MGVRTGRERAKCGYGSVRTTKKRSEERQEDIRLGEEVRRRW